MKARVLREEDLLDEGLLPNIDYCAYALRLSVKGRLPRAKHVLSCAVCLRRWRITEAEFQGWTPTTHRRAAGLMARMADGFAAMERDERYRPFYAHLASCCTCEHRFAELTFAVPVNLPQHAAKGAERELAPVVALK